MEQHDVIPLLIDYQTEFLLSHFQSFIKVSFNITLLKKGHIQFYNTYFSSHKVHITKNPLLLFIVSKLLITTSLDAYMYLARMTFRLIVIFLFFLMIHLFVSFDMTLLNVKEIQAIVQYIKIEIVPYKSIYVSSTLYNKDVLLEHDSTYCDTNLVIDGYF